ncbi:MAG: pyruvate dehydrogenase complex dihydrolipoamide acetyltransferase [Rhodospirillaceae bacterium]|jgi:pyruvate dehydrogenase E2 component (dihydrolipoamide acetyltransferase)
MPVQVLMPALSPTMTEGTLAKWHKKVGDDVQSGDVIAEIETDKATMEVEAVEEGKLGKILVEEGTEGVAVNTLIALILEEDEDESALEGVDASPKSEAKPSKSAEQPSEPSPQPKQQAALQQASGSNDGNRIKASPLAKRMAEQAGLDLGQISGSGPNGRIVKSDIEAALSGGQPKAAAQAAPQAAAPASQPAARAPSATVPAVMGEGSFTDEPVSSMRKVIAERLTESKQTIPHFYLTVECEIDALLAMRKDLNDRAPKGDGAYKLSVNDFVVRATALAMRKVPTVNASWQGDFIRKFHRVDISVAVATKSGLITPVVKDADNKGLAEISAEVKDLAARAQEGKLLPEEYQGGGFTISNMGMYDVKEFAAIINPPQSAIMAVSTGAQQPVVKDGALAIATVMNCTLSADHRVVDGAVGAEFMAAFKKLIEEPLTMLL